MSIFWVLYIYCISRHIISTYIQNLCPKASSCHKISSNHTDNFQEGHWSNVALFPDIMSIFLLFLPIVLVVLKTKINNIETPLWLFTHLPTSTTWNFSSFCLFFFFYLFYRGVALIVTENKLAPIITIMHISSLAGVHLPTFIFQQIRVIIHLINIHKPWLCAEPLTESKPIYMRTTEEKKSHVCQNMQFYIHSQQYFLYN